MSLGHSAVWCMRYESKHAYFKQTLNILGNFINVPWTLAIRHQQLICGKLVDAKGKLLKLDIRVPKNYSIVSLRNFKYGCQIACQHELSILEHSLKRITWIDVNSIKLLVNETIVLCYL